MPIAMLPAPAIDAALAIGDVAEIRRVATDALEQVRVLKEKLPELQKIAKDFKDFSKLDPEAQAAKAQELATDGQDALATLNECTRARKCNLVPYKSAGAGDLVGQRGRSKVEPANQGGCCPGQTGHHLIPEASLKNECKNYNHSIAPTLCVEGASQNYRSHKRVHGALASIHKIMDKNGMIGNDRSMRMNDGLNAAASSHARAFPLSNCSQKCIRSQLESYYSICRDSRPGMLTASSKLDVPSIEREK